MPKYYDFEIAIEGIEPRIWRRIRLPSTATFAELQGAIQDSFPWRAGHAWDFRSPGGARIAGSPSNEETPRKATPADTVTLASYFIERPPVTTCEYVYDFDNRWTHLVQRVDVVEQDAAGERRLLEGERAAPPEDCGGPDGYRRLVEFVATGIDPTGEFEDPEELTAWLCGWTPDGFHLADAKAAFDQ